MASVREQILEYVVARLEAITSTSPALKSRVHRSRQVPVRRGEGVRVLVEPVEEEVTAMIAQRVERMLTFRVRIVLHDDAPDAAADPIAVAIYAQLMGTESARRMGGLLQLPLQETSRVFPLEDADGTPIDYQINFVAPYRTTVGSEETVG